MAASLSIWIILIAIWIRFSHAEDRLDMVARICEPTPVEDVNKYYKHYASMVRDMTDDMQRNKFAFREAGVPPDKLHVMSQCMDHLSNSECVECFSNIADLLPGCFPSTGGRVYLDGCFIRADNYSFYTEIISDGDMKRCSDGVYSKAGLQEHLRQVVQKLVDQAPNNGGFGEVCETENGTTIEGMAQCWRTLDKAMCSTCLDDALSSAFRCLPSKEGRALNAGCFFRYSAYDFGNDPRAVSIRNGILLLMVCIFAAVVICTLAMLVGFCLGNMAYKRRDSGRKPKENVLDLAAMDRAMHFLQFKFSTLEKATDHFNEAHKLGSGGYGEVFKGTMGDGREIAIKRLYVNGKCLKEEIYNEVDVISRAQHKNLIRFLGGCFTTKETFLVYEFLANKSLDCILFDPEKKKELDWGKRHRIIIGTAEGLEYLHKGCEVQIIHRDIKASNILLDLKYRPKIADFGLARLCSRECDMNSSVNNAVAGTFGYMAPEYIAKGRLTEKVDVYSFGVLMLEIISGVKNTTLKSDNYFETLVTESWKHYKSSTTSKIIDETLGIEDGEEIKRAIQIGLLCTQANPDLRPSMSYLLQMLRDKEMEVPIPTKPPFLEEDVQLSSSSGIIRAKSYVYNLDRPQNGSNYEFL